jgi:uncharacterized protein
MSPPPAPARAPTAIAVVTGASAGIGAATARRLAAISGVELLLVARRADRLRRLAAELGRAHTLSVDLTDRDAPNLIAAEAARMQGELRLLVNNAGAAWRGEFGDTGWVNVERHLRLDFEAPVRLTEALLPALRAAAARGAGEPVGPSTRVSIVNIGSTASRIARPGAGAYSAAKFALAGWSDSLHAEEGRHGVHVGLVLPGFVATEGFPATELTGRRLTRRLVSRPEVVAEAIVEAAGWDGRRPRAERYVPRPYGALAALRVLAPGVMRRATRGGAFTTASHPRD